MSKRTRGTKVKPGEIKRYESLRDIGWAPEPAAETIGRSKSWAYNYEAKKRQGMILRSPGRKPHSKNGRLTPAAYQDAVDLISAIVVGDDDKAFDLFDRYGAGVVPLMAEVARFLANCRAIDLQTQLLDLYEGEEWEQEVRDHPITTEDILQAVPRVMERHQRGETYIQLQPPRADEWERRLLEDNPEFQDLADEVDRAYKSDDPEAAMREIKHRIRSESEEEEDMATTNGHH